MSTSTPTHSHSEFASEAAGGTTPLSIVRSISKEWGWIMAAGVASIIGGVVALTLPVLATGTVAMLIAATLMVVGVFNLTGTFFAEKGSKLESFLVGSIQVLLAAVMAFYPFATVISLTILVAAVLMAEGISRMVLAWAMRPVEGWGWILTSGIVTVAMCTMILLGLPQASLFVLGILVGVNLLVGGVARVAVALKARRVSKALA